MVQTLDHTCSVADTVAAVSLQPYRVIGVMQQAENISRKPTAVML